jgi:hypothetical protein
MGIEVANLEVLDRFKCISFSCYKYDMRYLRMANTVSIKSRQGASERGVENSLQTIYMMANREIQGQIQVAELQTVQGSVDRQKVELPTCSERIALLSFPYSTQQLQYARATPCQGRQKRKSPVIVLDVAFTV